MIAQVGYSVTGRSRGRVTPCAVCTVHVETRSASLLVQHKKQGRRFVSSLASKPVATISPGLTSKSVVVLLVEPQNQSGGGFHDLELKTDNYDLVI
jgi:hypothetical protein